MTRTPLFVLATLAALALAAAHPRAAQAQMTFGLPTPITTADATLTQPGTVFEAATYGGGSSTVTLTGGATIFFDGIGNNVTSSAYGTGSGSAVFTGDTGNAGFNAVLQNFAWGDQALRIINVKNLTAGQQYSIQIFALNDRPQGATGTTSFTDGLGNTSQSYAQGANDYVIGTFTATDSTFQFYQNTNGDQDSTTGTYANAYVIRQLAAPEPSSVAAFTIGLLGLGALAFKAKKHQAA